MTQQPIARNPVTQCPVTQCPVTQDPVTQNPSPADPATLKANLATFTGTEYWYRHPLVPIVRTTDGVQYLANAAGAHWLVDAIVLAQLAEQAVKATPFQVWKLSIDADRSATLVCTDGDYNEVWQQSIDVTDFPLDRIDLFFSDNTLYLPSEH